MPKTCAYLQISQKSLNYRYPQFIRFEKSKHKKRRCLMASPLFDQQIIVSNGLLCSTDVFIVRHGHRPVDQMGQF